MSIFSSLFKKRKPDVVSSPSQPENKPTHDVTTKNKPVDSKKSSSWSGRMQDLLQLARQSDKQSVPKLVDLLFETPRIRQPEGHAEEEHSRPIDMLFPEQPHLVAQRLFLWADAPY